MCRSFSVPACTIPPPIICTRLSLHCCVSMVACCPPRLPTRTIRPSCVHDSILVCRVVLTSSITRLTPCTLFCMTSATFSSRWLITISAPKRRSSETFSLLLVVVTTQAPACLANWMAHIPTPLEPAQIKTRSPALR